MPTERDGSDPRPSALDRALNRLTPIALASAGQQLADCGCAVDLVDVGTTGELDVRLLVGRADSAVSVELLGPCDGTGLQDSWCAVRIDPDGTRCVWTGPARSSPPEDLVTFVDTLFGTNVQSLRDSYTPVG